MRLHQERTSKLKAERNDPNSPMFSPATLRLSRLLRLTQKLQSSLDVRQQLDIFFQALQFHVAVDGLSFSAQRGSQDNRHITITLGSNERHRCQYKLMIEDRLLGTITFSRKQKFSLNEVVELESLITWLAYPIRNALMYQEAMQHAMTDALTGVGNRAHLNDTLERELKLTKRHHYRLSLLVLDVDYFKTINDQHGHHTGDLALKLIADGIRAMTRDTDRIFRFGGDEFVVLLDNTDECRARLVGERIRMHIENIKDNTNENNAVPRLNVTIGTATLQPDDTQLTLFARADAALYRAKQKGRNCVETSVNDSAVNRPADFAQTA